MPHDLSLVSQIGLGLAHCVLLVQGLVQEPKILQTRPLEHWLSAVHMPHDLSLVSQVGLGLAHCALVVQGLVQEPKILQT